MKRDERVARVEEALRRAGMDGKVMRLQENTATAAQAAQALGCPVADIAKSLMFRRVEDDMPVLAVLSGSRRVCAEKLARAAGGAVKKADADFVKARTGYEIGGVPPLGHDADFPVIMDAGLQNHETVWAAAGSAFAVFPAKPGRLATAAGAIIRDIAE